MLAKAMITSLFEPKDYFFIAKILAASPKFMGHKNLAQGFLAGFGFGFDRDLAQTKAMAEFMERYVAEVCATNIQRFSLKEAQKQKIKFVNPNLIRPYHSDKFIEKKFPIVNDDDVISYVLGEDIYKEKIWIPARSVLLPFIPKESETIFMSTTANGLAAHFNEDEAKKLALLEVIERHDLISSFRLKYPISSLSSEYLSDDIKQFLDNNNLKLRLFAIGNMPTILAMMTTKEDQKLSIGSKCGPLSLHTINAAISESLATRQSLEKAKPIDHAPRSSFEHMIKAFNNPKLIIKFYEHKSMMPSISLRSDLSLKEIISKVDALSPIYFINLGSYHNWHVIRAIMPHAYSKEGDSLYPHLKNFLQHHDIGELNLNPHPFG